MKRDKNFRLSLTAAVELTKYTDYSLGNEPHVFKVALIGTAENGEPFDQFEEQKFVDPNERDTAHDEYDYQKAKAFYEKAIATPQPSTADES
jgi:hypothetical protein